MQKEKRTRVRALGLWVDAVTRDQAADVCLKLHRDGRGGLLVAANLNYAQWANELPKLAEQNKRADLCVADGMSLVVASSLKALGGGDGRLPARVTGSDLVDAISAHLAATHGALWLVGRHAASINAAVRSLAANYPGLDVTAPWLAGAPLEREWTERLLELVEGHRPAFLFLALGQPHGDLWIEENRDRLGATVVLQVGGALDYLSGLQKRAPQAWGDCGLEWAYRLIHHPRRLGPRYWNNGRFLLAWLSGYRGGHHFTGGTAK